MRAPPAQTRGDSDDAAKHGDREDHAEEAPRRFRELFLSSRQQFAVAGGESERREQSQLPPVLYATRAKGGERFARFVKMWHSMLAYTVMVTHVTMAFHHHGVRMMMAKGFGSQSDRKQQTPVSSKVVVPPPTPKSPVVGDLPEDAFSQFPPLSPEKQKTLVGAQVGGGKGLPAEVSPDVSACTCWSAFGYAVSNRAVDNSVDYVTHLHPGP